MEAGEELLRALVNALDVTDRGTMTLSANGAPGLELAKGSLSDRAATPEATSPSSAPKAAKSGGTILFVDDEPALRKIAKWILEEAGFEVVVAADGTTGLATFQAEPSRFRAVVLDEQMPGLRGHELFARMRAIRADLPVVLMSGYLEVPLESEYVFLPKPYDGAALEGAVLRAIAQSTDG